MEEKHIAVELRRIERICQPSSFYNQPRCLQLKKQKDSNKHKVPQCNENTAVHYLFAVFLLMSFSFFIYQSQAVRKVCLFL